MPLLFHPATGEPAPLSRSPDGPPIDAGHAAGAWLLAQQTELARALATRLFDRYPEQERRLGPTARHATREDTCGLVAFLAQAVTTGRPEFFNDHLAWAKVMLARRGASVDDLARRLSLLRELLTEGMPAEIAAFATVVVDQGLSTFPEMPVTVPSHLDPAAPLAQMARDHLSLLLRADRATACQRILTAAAAGTPVRLIYMEVFQRTQREIGRLWQMNEISVAQEHYCTAATQMIMSQLTPQLSSQPSPQPNSHPAGDPIQCLGTLVATCVAGNLHEVGVRMLADLFELEGWNTYYLGGNTPTDAVLQTLIERQAQVLAVSATLSLHVPAVQDLIERLRADPQLAQVRVLVGGYPFNLAPDLWQQIGADGHARTADEAIALARGWVDRWRSDSTDPLP